MFAIFTMVAILGFGFVVVLLLAATMLGSFVSDVVMCLLRYVDVAIVMRMVKN